MSAVRTAPRRGRVVLNATRDVAANVQLRRLQYAWLGFVLSKSAYEVIVIVVAFNFAGTAGAAAVVLCRALPTLPATPLATWISHRPKLQRSLAITIGGRAAVMLLSALAIELDISIAVVIGLVAVDSVISTMFRPIVSVLLVSYARTPREIAAATAVNNVVQNVAMLVGPAVAGVLMVLSDDALPFALAAIPYVIGLVAGLRLTDPAESRARARRRPSLWHSVAEGWRVLSHAYGVRTPVFLYVAQMVVTGVWSAIYVQIGDRLLGMGEGGAGIIASALGAGGLAGALLTVGLVGKAHLVRPYVLGLLLWGPPIAAIGLFPDPAVGIAMAVLMGIGNSVMWTPLMMLLQRTLAKHDIGSVSSLLQAGSVIGIGIGGIAADPLDRAFTLEQLLIGLGCVMPILIAFAWLSLRRADDIGIIKADELRALRSVPMLSPLAPEQLERVALDAAALEPDENEDIVREGERGERFYMITSGLVDVLSGGRRLATLGPGGSFGEIALLREGTRTATVRARGEVELLALDADDFLGALDTEHTARATGGWIVESRLETVPADERLTEVDLEEEVGRAHIEAALRVIPHFASAGEEEIRRLASAAHGFVATPDTVIIRQGDYGLRFYVVLDGSVDLLREGRPVDVIPAGGTFGETALVHDIPRTGTARARTHVLLLALDREHFRAATRGA